MSTQLHSRGLILRYHGLLQSFSLLKPSQFLSYISIWNSWFKLASCGRPVALAGLSWQMFGKILPFPVFVVSQS